MAKSTSFDAEFAAAERAIQQGRAPEARKWVLDAASRRIPRENLVKLAGLFRRLGLYQNAVILLNPWVRPAARKTIVTTDAEKAEYAANLSYLGASAEALSLLREIKAASCPEATLFQSFAHIMNWEYREAMPLLKSYLDDKTVSDYQKLVARVNLASALIFERECAEASTLLSEIIDVAKSNNYILLLGNALELSAQNEIGRMDYSKARGFLEEAREISSTHPTRDSLNTEKWSAVLSLIEKNGSTDAVAELVAVKEKAIEMKYYEAVRDCDKFLGLKRDRDLLLRVYYGSPFESYRKQILLNWGKEPIPASYLWTLTKHENPKYVFDLQEGKMRGGDNLKMGALLHQLFTALCQDLYRPQRIASLHAAIYKDKVYNPVHSPAKTHRLLHRLRQWLTENKVPLELKEEGFAYSLCAISSVGILLPRPERRKEERTVDRLGVNFGEKPFSVREAAAVLGKSVRQTVRSLAGYVDNGTLSREGNSTATRYKVKIKNAA